MSYAIRYSSDSSSEDLDFIDVQSPTLGWVPWCASCSSFSWPKAPYGTYSFVGGLKAPYGTYSFVGGPAYQMAGDPGTARVDQGAGSAETSPRTTGVGAGPGKARVGEFGMSGGEEDGATGSGGGGLEGRSMDGDTRIARVGDARMAGVGARGPGMSGGGGTTSGGGGSLPSEGISVEANIRAGDTGATGIGPQVVGMREGSPRVFETSQDAGSPRANTVAGDPRANSRTAGVGPRATGANEGSKTEKVKANASSERDSLKSALRMKVSESLGVGGTNATGRRARIEGIEEDYAVPPTFSSLRIKPRSGQGVTIKRNGNEFKGILNIDLGSDKWTLTGHDSFIVSTDEIFPFFENEKSIVEFCNRSTTTTTTTTSTTWYGATSEISTARIKQRVALIMAAKAAAYRESLNAQGLDAYRVDGDGNCLFRSVSHQIYGTEAHHQLVREACADYMLAERTYFEPFVAELCGKSLGRAEHAGFVEYVQETRKFGVWGDDPELQALCEIYQRNAEVFAWDEVTKSAKLLRRFHEDAAASSSLSASSSSCSKSAIRLSYYGGGHYDSIIATASSRTTCASPPPGVGFWETRAVDAARARGAGGISLATKLSDLHETERIQMDEALTRSRQTCNQQRASGFDTQEALVQSLQHAEQVEGEMLKKVKEQSEREVEDQELVRVMAESAQAAQRMYGMYDDEDDDDAMMRFAIEESLRR